MINSLSTSVSGLLAASRKAAVSAENIANASTTGTLDSTDELNAYRPQDTVTVDSGGGGVRAAVYERENATVAAFDPNSPYADDNGLVEAPNVNLDEEIITQLEAANAYKANAKVLGVSKNLHDTLMRVFDEKV